MGGDPMMGGMPPMDDPGMGGMPPQNPFDTNFDAGVEADENADPKKYIQQLTGKLSQSLRNYNDGQPQADADLNKYVAGMIIKQAIEGLSPEDVQEVLGKVKSGEDMQEPQDGQQPPMDMQPPMGDPNAQQPMDPGMGGQQPPQMESRKRADNRKLVYETMPMFDKEDDGIRDDKPKAKRHSYKTLPFGNKRK